MQENEMLTPNPLMPGRSILIDSELCTGCNHCVDVCRTDVLVPNPEKGKSPIVLYPDECWFGGCCVGACPVPGAIKMQHALTERVGWKRKETGEWFRVGMKNPPPPNTRPPVS